MSHFQRGFDCAEEEMRDPEFDVLSAICSFDGDPPDNNFQRGYLNALLATHEEQN
jgi:hypothetical protein